MLCAIDILLILLIMASSMGIWFARRSLPQTSGRIFLTGLQQEVFIGRDRWGVPSISASTMHDLLFAQGYVTTQDRLFQMEMSRRITQGRLAEVFGPGSDDQLIETDAFLRTLGVYRAIQSQLSQIDAQTRTAFQAYTDGVNAFINTHQDHLPLEFSILGIDVAPWTIADSVAVEANIVLALDDAWYYKYTRALILSKVGPSLTSMLFPSYPTQNPTLFAVSNQALPSPFPYSPSSTLQSITFPDSLLDGINTLHALLGNINGSLGSNNWVVDGTRTSTGKPLLANDPHLDTGVPSTWYEVALYCGSFEVIGFSLPGVPGVVIGHNTSIAWGITNVGADTADLYLEKLDPAKHPAQYLYNHQWMPLQTRQQVIHVRGMSKSITITVAATKHGPLLNSAVDDLKGYTAVSLKWTLLQPEYRIANFLQLDAATNWSQFSNALSALTLCQNFVYADIEGNIGYRMSGLLPIRPKENETLPVDGSITTYDWQGFVAQEQLPALFNPPSHTIVTANNRIIPDTYPIYISHEWDQGYRARRIDDLLAEIPHLSISDYERIQSDVYSIPASILTPYFIMAGQTRHDSDTALAVKLLKQWNYTLTRDSTGATIYEMTAGLLLSKILEPLLGKHLYAIYQPNYSHSGFFTFLINTLTLPKAPFFSDAGGGNAYARRDAVIASVLQETVKQLRTRYGSDTTQWYWGKIHKAHFSHPLSGTAPLNLLFGVTQLERPGDNETINIGGDDGFNADPPNYDQHTVSSMREIIDLANFDNSLWIITTGESGQPFSNHYNDLNSLWDQDRYQSMSFSPQRRTLIIRERLILCPTVLQK